MLQHSATAPLYNYKCEHRYSEMCVLWRFDWMDKIKETLDFYCCTVHFDNIKIIFTNKCTLLLNT